jgi:hypothetical protein
VQAVLLSCNYCDAAAVVQLCLPTPTARDLEVALLAVTCMLLLFTIPPEHCKQRCCGAAAVLAGTHLAHGLEVTLLAAKHILFAIHPTRQAALLWCSCCDAIAVLAGTHLAHDLEVALLAVKHLQLLSAITAVLLFAACCFAARAMLHAVHHLPTLHAVLAQTHLAHDLEVALLAVKHGLLAVGQALEVNLHDALEEGRVDGHWALVDGHSVLGVSGSIKGLQEGQQRQHHCCQDTGTDSYMHEACIKRAAA